MTHQEISDAFGSIYQRAHVVAEAERKWIEEERARLVAECGKIGHIWGKEWAFRERCCLVCGANPE